MSREIDRLLAIMALLRDPERGCEWDTAQDFDTIAPYTIEEAYEVADAIARKDMAELQAELGDLLFQVVFHSRMAEETGHFAFDDVAKAISDKMEARHPHVFADNESPGWEALKAEERAKKGSTSAMDGVVLSLPALLRALKLQKRAARSGFDWPDAEGPKAKVAEEIGEIEQAAPTDLEEEFGDLLFAVVNWARKSGVDPEEALRSANAKFERRFRAMERAEDEDFASLNLEAQEALWQQVKCEESSQNEE